MKEKRESIIPIPPKWKPDLVCDKVVEEVEKWWEVGWVFKEARSDTLLSSVCLFFEREIHVES